jgi:hypothetical protein
MENLLPPCFFLDSGLEIGGEAKLIVAIQVAQLALKNRQNKQQLQRIIVFIGRYSLRLHQSLFY